MDAERTIEVANEQLIVDWGISIAIDQPAYSGQSNGYTEPLGWAAEYANEGNGAIAWYTGIPDQDGETEWNWIRSGLAGDTALQYEDYLGYDDDQTLP